MPLIYAYKKRDNQKIVYVGQTINLSQRRYAHEKRDPFNSSLIEYHYPLSRGIRKYGIDAYECIILENNIPTELINEREQYWISYYNTYEDPEGYNQTPGGELKTKYIKFNEGLIDEAKKLIKEKMPFSKISERTGISIVMLSEINQGKRHFDEHETYPLNPMTSNRSLTDIQVKEIIDLLKKGEATFQQIGEKFNVSENVIQAINIGKNYHQNNISYPIKTQRVISGKRKTLKEDDLILLIKDIINTNIPFSKLSQKYGISTSTIYNINNGKTRKKENYEYPLRK